MTARMKPSGLTSDNLQAFLERETIADFINLESYAEDDKGNGFYQCRNGYRGFVFEVYPSSNVGLNEHETIVSALGYGYPIETVFEVLYLPSRNITKTLQRYEDGHSKACNISNPAAINTMSAETVKWLKANRDSSIIKSPLLNIRPRDIKTLVIVMIPPVDNKNAEILDTDIIKYSSITEGKLTTLSPRRIKNNEFISIVNEIITPGKTKGWDIEYDEGTPLYNHFCSSEDTIGECEEDSSIIKYSTEGEDDLYSAVLTTKTYPSRYNIVQAKNLFFNTLGKEQKNHFSGPYYISLKISVEDKDKLKKVQKAKAQANKYQVNLLGPKAKEFFPRLKEVEEETTELIERLDNKGDIILKTQWCMVVSDKDKVMLKQSKRNLIKKIGCSSKRQRYL